MFRNTNNVGSRRRSHSNESRERRKIIFYRCNNIGHIARNCRTPDDQCNRMNVPICQLCNNFGHTTKFVEWIEETSIGTKIKKEIIEEVMIV